MKKRLIYKSLHIALRKKRFYQKYSLIKSSIHEMLIESQENLFLQLFPLEKVLFISQTKILFSSIILKIM